MAGPSGDPEAHKFIIEYHPHSKHAHETKKVLDGGNRKPSPPRNLELWSPFFKSCEDFEIMEVIMKVRVSKADCNCIFKAFRRCLAGKGSFNLNNFSDLWGAWECASETLESASLQLSDISLLNGPSFSLRSVKFQSLTRVKIRYSRYTIIHFGNGRLTSSQTSTWLCILNGMHRQYISLVKVMFILSCGLCTHFRIFKYASHLYQISSCKLYLLFQKINILESLRVHVHYLLSSMWIKQNYWALAWKNLTQWLHDALIYPLRSETAMV